MVQGENVKQLKVAIDYLFNELGIKRLAGQLFFYCLFFAFIGYFADQPEFVNLASDKARLKLAVRHASKLLGECKQLDQLALQQLAPNMRSARVCPRERSPVTVELALDEKVIFINSIEPAGLHNDGITALYEQFDIKAGPVHISLKLDDDINTEGYSHLFERDFLLGPAQILVIEFNGGFDVHLSDTI